MYKIYIIIIIIIIAIVFSTINNREFENFVFTTEEEQKLKKYASNKPVIGMIDTLEPLQNTLVKNDEYNTYVENKIPIIPSNINDRILTDNYRTSIDKSAKFFEGIDNIDNYFSLNSEAYNLLPNKIYNMSNQFINDINSKIDIFNEHIYLDKSPKSYPPVNAESITNSTDKYLVFTYNNQDIIKGYTSYNLELFDVTICDFLIVGGGGSGGDSFNSGSIRKGGGGGGAGGLIYKSSILLLKGMYEINVGKGGLSANSEKGVDSSIMGSLGYIGRGGGAGGSYNSVIVKNSTSGGSGGGGLGGGDMGSAVIQNTYEGIGFGNKGGSTTSINPSGGGGGGGGGGTQGSDTSTGTGGLGGMGKDYAITSTNITYAKGGDGGSSIIVANGTDGNVNTGGGGGGGGKGGKGGNGGSGIVIIRYKSFDSNERINNISLSIEYLRENFNILELNIMSEDAYIRNNNRLKNARAQIADYEAKKLIYDAKVASLESKKARYLAESALGQSSTVPRDTDFWNFGNYCYR